MVKAMTIFIIFLPEYPQIICPQNILLSNAVNILCKDDSGDIFKQHFTMNMDFMESNYKMWELDYKESWA